MRTLLNLQAAVACCGLLITRPGRAARRRPGAGRLRWLAALSVAGAFALAGCVATPEPAPEPVVAPAPPSPPAFEPITFSSGTVEIDIAARSSLRRVSGILLSPEWSAWPIEIEGHSDLAGGADANLRVSERRAEAVARELEFNGVERERMVVRAFGETQPRMSERRLDGSHDPEAAAANRRVEVRLVERP